jgi:hypothetical protein
MLPFNTSQIQAVTATAAWKNTNVQTTQASNPFGQATVQVTSEDGQNIKIYTIYFQRKGNPYLLDLSYNLDGTSIPVPGFNPLTFEYFILLDIGTTATPLLEYVIEDDRCFVDTVQQTTPNGTSSFKFTTWNYDDSLTYTVNFTVKLSQEALLCSLQVDGVSVPNFNSHTFNYIWEQFEYGTEEFPVITAEACEIDATVVIEQVEVYPGVATIKVTAGETSITNTYTISFSVEPGDNNFLDAIYIDGVPLFGFDKYIYFYTRQLEHGVTQAPQVDAIAEDPRATVDKEQAPQPGDTAKIWVTALNGDVALYQVHFLPGKNNNAYLEMIYIDGKPLEGFVRYLPNYEYILPYNYTGLPWVTYEKEDPNAEAIKEDIYDTNPPQTKIFVTAEDGLMKFVYTITFLRESSVFTYNNETEINVYPNPTSDNIHFEINGLPQTGYLEIITMEGKTMGKHILQDGINTVNVEHLSKGIYFYKIFTDRTMLGTGKFVKK